MAVPELTPRARGGWLTHGVRVLVNRLRQIADAPGDFLRAGKARADGAPGIGAAPTGMRVAIVMCTFNGADHLAEQLASLARQSRAPDELVVGDDASTDATVAMLEAFAATAPFPVRIIRRPARLGYAANFIATARATDCDLILFCDQDDVWHADKVRVVVEAAGSSPAPVFSHDLAITFDGGARAEETIPSYFGHLRDLGLAPDLCCKGCALAVRASFIRSIGWPPPPCSVSHDAWFGLLSTALGRREFLDVPLVRHRIHGRNASGWIVRAEEKLRKAKAPADQPFASMLEFYIGDWNRDWLAALEERLEAAGEVDPARSRAAGAELSRRRRAAHPR